ncbi:MAG: hypothetical protein JSW61_00715 [Candidatus Thorarchaeota archaeon]|nr:MAG: hypothetical protein JSW61_00715 [Candidatus Thorarchaeota archaeon]
MQGQLGEESELNAVFLYMGILDAYEAVGVELIGPDVLEEHVLPRMTYYVREFLPEIFSERADSEELTTELRRFLTEFRARVEDAREKGVAGAMTMEEIWELRAAIFGFESVFINILGDSAIKNYVLIRMADILSAYLPESLLDPQIPLKTKLESYAKYIQDNKFVGFARVSFGDDEISVAANRCEFSRIHDSEAYRNLDVRFCPWGMIASAIVAAHEGKETNLESSLFTTKGSVSKIKAK